MSNSLTTRPTEVDRFFLAQSCTTRVSLFPRLSLLTQFRDLYVVLTLCARLEALFVNKKVSLSNVFARYC